MWNLKYDTKLDLPVKWKPLTYSENGLVVAKEQGWWERGELGAWD